MSRVPLAELMRPERLDEVIGQKHLLGKSEILSQIVAKKQPVSLILWGPPGTGKTTLARIIAREVEAEFIELSAVTSGKKDIERVVEHARQNWNLKLRTVLFVDEIHRFSKSQQDAFLPHVESGLITLIGATTENPSFEVITPLLSRMRALVLQPLTKDEILEVIKRALKKLKKTKNFTPKAIDLLAEISGGDARVALNLLEQSASLANFTTEKHISIDILKQIIGDKIQRYDKNGDNHYDTISAFIKSMRGSDPDAAIHYLARMLVAGEDVNFIARRVVICAAEDVGNADPEALNIAMAAAKAVQFLGMPEGRIPLAQAVTYIATAPKSNASYLAIDQAICDVKSSNSGLIPVHLRDAHYKGAIKLGHGATYKYPHDYEGSFVEQNYLPEELKNKKYYNPTENGFEREIKKRIENLWREK